MRIKQATPWAPRAEITPSTCSTPDGCLVVRSNGSAGCYGGWDLRYQAPKAEYVKFRVKVRGSRLERGLDCVHIGAMWEGDESLPLDWEPILPSRVGKDHIVYESLIRVQPRAKHLIVRLCLAWSAFGEVCFEQPDLTAAARPRRRRWRLGAGGGYLPSGERTLQSNTKFYLNLCRQAAEDGVDLLCLPEVMLQWCIPCNSDALPSLAFEVPGKEIEPFQMFARENQMALCFSVFERERELIYNTALLLDKRGELIGKYRKVHLAPPLEPWWGVAAGHDFPVHNLHGVKVGMNICMDSSALESARVPARRGAEILLMPIMGDHRAVSEWKWAGSDFDIDRWTCIQRVRAMDNQLYMVVSRNSGYGSGIFAPDGTVLAISGGKQVVWADVDFSDLPRTWTGATFRNVCWFERREPTYQPLVGGDIRALRNGETIIPS